MALLCVLQLQRHTHLSEQTPAIASLTQIDVMIQKELLFTSFIFHASHDTLEEFVCVNRAAHDGVAQIRKPFCPMQKKRKRPVSCVTHAPKSRPTTQCQFDLNLVSNAAFIVYAILLSLNDVSSAPSASRTAKSAISGSIWFILITAFPRQILPFA